MSPPAMEAGPRDRNAGDLKDLAKWPAKAHQAWTSLSEGDRLAVTNRMTGLYGKEFAKDFIESTKSGAEFERKSYSGLPEITTAWLKKHGYALAAKDSNTQTWVHPSGREKIGAFSDTGAQHARDIGAKQGFAAALAAIAAHDKALHKKRADLWDWRNNWRPPATATEHTHQFEQYRDSVEDLQSEAEAARDDAQGLRNDFAPKGVDVKPLDKLIANLTDVDDIATLWLTPGELNGFKPQGPSILRDLPEPVQRENPPATQAPTGSGAPGAQDTH